jgi:hypothetical protein
LVTSPACAALAANSAAAAQLLASSLVVRDDMIDLSQEEFGWSACELAQCGNALHDVGELLPMK